jgi:hypothetical protein
LLQPLGAIHDGSHLSGVFQTALVGFHHGQMGERLRRGEAGSLSGILCVTVK